MANEETLQDFYRHVKRMVDESDRRYDNADFKVSKYMVKRITCARNSLNLMLTSTEELPRVKLNLILVKVNELLRFWEDKKLATEQSNRYDANFERYSCKAVSNGGVGRPRYSIDLDLVACLREYHFTWEMIGKILSVSRSTLWRRLNDSNHNIDISYSTLSAEELNDRVRQIKKAHPLAGERMIIGFLRAKRIYVQRWRVRESIHAVDPINCANRWLNKTTRWVYRVPGPNSLWHNDGLHKMIHWGMIIHACIDGYSRIVTSLLCASNNYASTALTGFLKGVERFGIPTRVRGDKGGENIHILNYMRSHHDDFSAYLQGPSVHNQRIERLHYDTTHCVLSYFIGMFHFMEEHEILVRSNSYHIFSLQYVFMPRIQKSLDNFQEAWNHHQLSTEGNKSPYQLWMLGMMNHDNSNQKAVQKFFHDEDCDLFGVDPSPSLGIMPDDTSLVELHDIDFNHVNMDTLIRTLQSEFDPQTEDNNHGIDIYIGVRDRVVELCQ